MDLKTMFLSSFWIAIWTNPRETVQKFYSKISEFLSVLLFILGHISILIYIFYYYEIFDVKGDYIRVVLKFILVGTVWGLYDLYINCKSIEILGKKLGGKASFRDIRKALSLAQIPLLYGLISNVIKILTQVILFKYFHFKFNGMDIINSNVFLSLFFTFCFIIDGIIVLKSPVLYLSCLSEIQGFDENEGLVLAEKNTCSYFSGIPIFFLYMFIDKFF